MKRIRLIPVAPVEATEMVRRHAALMGVEAALIPGQQVYVFRCPEAMTEATRSMVAESLADIGLGTYVVLPHGFTLDAFAVEE